MVVTLILHGPLEIEDIGLPWLAHRFTFFLLIIPNSIFVNLKLIFVKFCFLFLFKVLIIGFFLANFVQQSANHI